jgi:nitrate reductase delta subunit
MMTRDPSLLLRALSALLAYPDAELRAALPEIADTVRDARAIDAALRERLVALVDEITASDPLEAEGRYVDLFDRGRRTSLNLFEHVHGDGRQRGPAMLELKQRYLDAGLEPVADELPDHLPLLLEYLSCRDAAEVRDTIGEIAHILRVLGNTLLKRRSRYAAVMAALLALGGEKGLDAQAPVPPDEDLDQAWEEKPAFAPPEPNPAVTPERAAP